MCLAECFGDQHRGCGHYIRIYYTGETRDCEQPNCRLSRRHVHGTSKTCGCRDYYDDYQRVSTILQTHCDDCVRRGLPGQRT